jgi:uncharacterized SAM-binding protein YcdF (DUF218 family)
LIDPYWLKALLKQLVLPPTGPLLVSAFGLALVRSHPRLGRALAFVGILSLLLLSMPVVSNLLRQSVGGSPVLDLERAKSAQAIVILGGGTHPDAPEYGGDTLGHLTLERVRYGARVARLTGLPILVTGGAVSGGEPEARLMRQSLEREFGVDVNWAEDQSRNTRENAIRSAAILQAQGIHRVVLVAHDFDMRRASAEFAAAGIDAIAAPTGTPAYGVADWRDFLPSIPGLEGSYYALYEILGNLVRVISGAR